MTNINVMAIMNIAAPNSPSGFLNKLAIAIILIAQLHTLNYWLTINHRGATANSPEPSAVAICCQAVTLFLIQKLIENHRCGSPRKNQTNDRCAQSIFQLW
ncbi:hypothetical protein KQI57_14450 [Citrobacter cronae]|nr:hypothetical protein [Citrobacter cronae]